MTGRNSSDVFNATQFLRDVEAYRTRQGITVSSIATQCGMDSTYLRRIMDGDIGLSLYMACKLGDMADLTMDVYRVPRGEQESRRLDRLFNGGVGKQTRKKYGQQIIQRTREQEREVG